MKPGTLTTLAGFFALMSLFAIGGANSAVPEMHRFAVAVKHWMTDQEFSDIFALAQVTPGPNVIIVTLAPPWWRRRRTIIGSPRAFRSPPRSFAIGSG